MAIAVLMFDWAKVFSKEKKLKMPFKMEKKNHMNNPGRRWLKPDAVHLASLTEFALCATEN